AMQKRCLTCNPRLPPPDRSELPPNCHFCATPLGFDMEVCPQCGTERLTGRRPSASRARPKVPFLVRLYGRLIQFVFGLAALAGLGGIAYYLWTTPDWTDRPLIPAVAAGGGGGRGGGGGVRGGRRGRARRGGVP